MTWRPVKTKALPWFAAPVLLFALLVFVPACSDGVPSVETLTSAQGAQGPSPPEPSQLELKALEWEQQLKQDPGLEVGRLVIPSLGLDMAVLEMTDEAVLDKGLGHWPETPLPGLKGHFVVSGHRSTRGSPFRRLGELLPGDALTVILPYAVVEYQVTRVSIVEPSDMEVVRSRGVEELSLATCHPLGSEEFRLVVRARAVSFSPTE